MTKHLLGILLVSAILTPQAFAGDDAIIFKKGQAFARQQKLDFAYMKFRDIVLHHPRSPLHERSLFATGEYFYIIANFAEAAKIFSDFVELYPESKLKIFALGYLYDIASKNNDTELTEKLKTDIITRQQVALVFRNAKEYTYKSPLYRQYHGLIQIDKITISCDGQALAEISY